ncbi:MAG: phosphate ABC transporter substrate-binding protein [Verrucomicrobiales bacterium]|nr:phosphate ABC transporter substrate-binding protein [Verrucomicrobiales bacterium]
MTTNPVNFKSASGIVLTGMIAISSTAAAVEADPKLPTYKQTSGVSGTLNSVGSDTLNNLMALWSESFRAVYPNVTFQVEGKGSSTAPPALVEGTSQIGPMSRAMKNEEIDAFQKKFGYKPTNVSVAIDSLAVFVHKDNPVEGLTLQQVDGIFSSTQKLGGKELKTWGDIGLKGAWASRPASLYGRNSASGTYGYFQKVALGKGDYKSSVKEQPGSSAVVQGIGSDKYGVGYSGIGYLTSGVRALPLGTEEGKFFEANMANCLNGNYPLARSLYIYANKKPGEPVDKLTLEFLKFVLSKEGQEIVVKDGYFPLPAEVAAQMVSALAK